MLPKRRRAVASRLVDGDARTPCSPAAAREHRELVLAALPPSSGSGKLSAISCRHSTSKSAMRFASATMRAGSTSESTPRHHCTFHVISFIGFPPA
jgi:hypothetical protein